jgi:hypothetical protein
MFRVSGNRLVTPFSWRSGIWIVTCFARFSWVHCWGLIKTRLVRTRFKDCAEILLKSFKKVAKIVKMANNWCALWAYDEILNISEKQSWKCKMFKIWNGFWTGVAKSLRLKIAGWPPRWICWVSGSNTVGIRKPEGPVFETLKNRTFWGPVFKYL